MVTITFSATTSPKTLTNDLQGAQIALVYPKYIQLAKTWCSATQRAWEGSQCAVLERKPLQSDEAFALAILRTASML
jgi:hypothetical protein